MSAPASNESSRTIRDEAAALGFNLTEWQVTAVEAAMSGRTLVMTGRRWGRAYAFRAAQAIAEQREQQP